MAKQLFANNAIGRLNAGITDVATSFVLQAGQGALFPSPTGGDWFIVTLYEIGETGEQNHEIVKCTARTGDTLTVTRAQEGTTGRAFLEGTPVELRVTKGALTDIATNSLNVTTATIGTSSGVLKATTGSVSVATAGTDYVVPGGALGTPSSGTLTNCTFPTLNQSTTGNAATVTVADAASDATTWVLLGTSQTGNLSPATDAGLTYNASTNALTATTFVGALTGTASGNLTSGGALGTPSSGTLTNCTSLPVSGITGSTTQALGVGSLELGHGSDTTITRVSAGEIAVEGNAIYRAGGTDVALADGGTGASLADPNADRLLFWDDSAGAVTWLTPGTGLTITGTTIDAAGGGTSGFEQHFLLMGA